jgi:hypothetical protein
LFGHESLGVPFLDLSVTFEESFSRTLIASGLDESIDYVTILVDSPSQILSLTLDRNEQLVQVHPAKTLRTKGLCGA